MISTISTQIITALSRDLGPCDLTDAGKVLRGRFADPPANFDAFVGICSPTVSSEQGPEIRRFLRRLSYQIDGWVSVEEDTTWARAVRGEALADGIMTALENARFDNAYAGGLFDCRDFVCGSNNFEADFDPVPRHYARIVVTLELSYSVDRGL